jgi:dihydrofolate reductase
MSKLIVTEFVTLDGIIESPHHWSLGYWNEAIDQFKNAELHASGALLLGRVTYEAFATSWPERSGDFADRFNALPKFVASSTLKDPTWTGTTVLGDTLAEVRALKTRIEGDIVIHGSNQLAVSLLEAGLIDEVRLLTYPVVRGSGLRLFQNGNATLELVESKPMGGGVTLCVYRPCAPEAKAAAA